jgi:hypothetical protein
VLLQVRVRVRQPTRHRLEGPAVPRADAPPRRLHQRDDLVHPRLALLPVLVREERQRRGHGAADVGARHQVVIVIGGGGPRARSLAGLALRPPGPEQGELLRAGVAEVLCAEGVELLLQRGGERGRGGALQQAVAHHAARVLEDQHQQLAPRLAHAGVGVE